MTRNELVEAFYGTDPLLARDAAEELAKESGEDIIRSLVPLKKDAASIPLSIEPRVKRLAMALGSSIVPHLLDAIRNGSEDAKYLASRYYGGVECTAETEKSLLDILEKNSDLKSCGYAIEALGFLGVSSLWAGQFSDFAQCGNWDERNSVREVDRYALEKLSPATIRTLVRFMGRVSSNYNAQRLLRILTDLVFLIEQEFASHSPTSYDRVQAVRHDFSNQSLDALMQQWGEHKDRELQKTCFAIIGELAPRRATSFLLEVVSTHQETDPELSAFASLALGEIRHREVADRVAEACKAYDDSRRPTPLLYAFSALYPALTDRYAADKTVETVLGSGYPYVLRYSLALCGDGRCQESLVEYLDAGDSETRWMSALSLARLLKTEAYPYLEHRVNEAANAVERAAFYAALIRAGDTSQVDSLHTTLQDLNWNELSSTVFVPTVWKLEILDAFRLCDDFRSDAFELWCEVAGVSDTKRRYFDEILQALKRATRSVPPVESEVPTKSEAPPNMQVKNRDHPYHTSEVLVERLYSARQEKERHVVFLAGSPLSMPDPEGKHGVPGVSGVIDLIRREFVESNAETVFDQHLVGEATNQYQKAFEFLHGSRGQEVANRIVQTAVCQALKDKKRPSPLLEEPPRGLDSDTCNALEREVGAWGLPHAVDMLGKLLATYPAFGRKVLTTNFDPLIEVSVLKHGGQYYKTRLYKDGNPDQTDGEGTHIVHLHGYWHGSDTLHMPQQLVRPRPQLSLWLKEVFETSTLVVLGYGGWDDVVTQTLADVPENWWIKSDILWAFHEKDAAKIEASNQKLLGLLGSGISGGRVTLYRGIDCRSVLADLHERLNPSSPTAPAPTKESVVNHDSSGSGWPYRVQGMSPRPERLLSERSSRFLSEFERLKTPEDAFGIRMTAMPVGADIRFDQVFRQNSIVKNLDEPWHKVLYQPGSGETSARIGQGGHIPSVEESRSGQSGSKRVVEDDLHRRAIFPSCWQPMLRAARAEPCLDHHSADLLRNSYREIHCDGLVEWGFVEIRQYISEGKPRTSSLSLKLVIPMFANLVLWADQVRGQAHTPTAEYTLEVEIYAKGGPVPVGLGGIVFGMDIGRGTLPPGSTSFPGYPLGIPDEFNNLLQLFDRDFQNSCGRTILEDQGTFTIQD